MGTGIYNITYYPAVFRAFDPSRAVMRTLQSRSRVGKDHLTCRSSFCPYKELRLARGCPVSSYRMRSHVCQVCSHFRVNRDNHSHLSSLGQFNAASIRVCSLFSLIKGGV
jgi:hypothetical protein